MRLAGVIRLGLVASAVGALEAACRLGWIKKTVIIAPSEMASALTAILLSGRLARHIGSTLGNVALAGLLAIAGGIVIGVGLHALPRLRRAIDPVLASYYAVPFFVFYPLFIVMFGMNDAPIVVIGFLFAVVAMVISVLNGLDRIPPVLLKVARLDGLGRWDTARLIQIPAAAPHLFTGVKLAIAYAFIGVIASEFILSGAGLGYSIAFAYNNFDNRTMYALMLLIIGLVTLVNGALLGAERRLLRHRQRT